MLAVTVALVAYQQVSAEGLRSLGRVHLANLLTGGRPGGPAANLLFLALLVVATRYMGATFELALELNLCAVLAAGGMAAMALSLACRATFRDAGPLRGTPGTGAPACGSRVAGRGDLDQAALLRACVPLVVLRCLAFFTVQADLWIAAGTFPARADVASAQPRSASRR